MHSSPIDFQGLGLQSFSLNQNASLVKTQKLRKCFKLHTIFFNMKYTSSFRLLLSFSPPHCRFSSILNIGLPNLVTNPSIKLACPPLDQVIPKELYVFAYISEFAHFKQHNVLAIYIYATIDRKYANNSVDFVFF